MTQSRKAIEAISGRFLDLENPQVGQISVEDIVWGLCRMPRYAGHTIGDSIYSVGQHSLLVAENVVNLLRKEDPETRAEEYAHQNELMNSLDKFLANDVLRESVMSKVVFCQESKSKTLMNSIVNHALIHDASEAYLMDLPAPIKNLPGIKEAYAALEEKVMAVIAEYFGLQWPMPDFYGKIIHWSDLYVRAVEAEFLIASHGRHWEDKPSVSRIDLEDFQLHSFSTVKAVLTKELNLINPDK